MADNEHVSLSRLAYTLVTFNCNQLAEYACKSTTAGHQIISLHSISISTITAKIILHIK